MKNYRIDMKNIAFAWAALLLTSAPAAAATLCVDPTDAGCYIHIQDAVDEAAAGDTIKIASGSVYEETVTIPTGKNGLVLDGGGSALIDNRSDMDAIVVLSDEVQITNMIIRNSRVGITIGDNDLVIPQSVNIHGVAFKATAHEAILGYGSDAITIDNCSFFGISGTAISLTDGSDTNGADHATVRDGWFDGCGKGCVYISGEAAEVDSNTMNRVAGSTTISLYGDDNVVTNNLLRRSIGGINVSGANPRITDNRVTMFGGGDGIQAYCTSNCDSGATVARNRASKSADDNGAFDVSAEAPGMTVEHNAAAGTPDEGFFVGGTGIVFTHNRVSGIGGDSYESGIEVFGSGHTIANNVSIGSAEHGIYVGAVDTVISGNVVKKNHAAGVSIGFPHLDEDHTLTVEGNQALKNLGEGYQVWAEDDAAYAWTTFTKNLSQDNRSDYCTWSGKPGPLDGGGNSFDVTKPATCVVDH